MERDSGDADQEKTDVVFCIAFGLCLVLLKCVYSVWVIEDQGTKIPDSLPVEEVSPCCFSEIKLVWIRPGGAYGILTGTQLVMDLNTPRQIKTTFT
jgi:hypothetical protein